MKKSNLAIKTAALFVLLVPMGFLFTGCEAGPSVSPNVTSKELMQVYAKGDASPSIYFHPIFRDGEMPQASSPSSLKNKDGQSIAMLSASQAAACAFQTSCSLIKQGKMRHFDIDPAQASSAVFYEYQVNRCPYGIGEKNICLDPFFSVATKNSIYPLGTVFYVPALRDMVLPTGEVHEGYVIVRDKLEATARRISFFTGFYAPNNTDNIFVTSGLGDPGTLLGYQIVKNAEIVKQVLAKRGYPNLPPLVLERGLKEIETLSNQ